MDLKDIKRMLSYFPEYAANTSVPLPLPHVLVNSSPVKSISTESALFPKIRTLGQQ